MKKNVALQKRVDDAFSQLKKAGLKRTPNRESLLCFLIANHGPFSKEEIHGRLSDSDVDGVTLYRNLSAFEKAGIIRRSEFGDGISRYEFEQHANHHHHHVICTGCRRVDHLDSCGLIRLEKRVRRLGYTKIRHSLEFFGLCEKCS